MNLENTLYYFTHHSESIIQWLFFGILLLSALIIGRAIFAKREAASAGGVALADNGEIQSFLQKILDQTAKLETVKLEGLSAGGVAEVDAQVQALKKDLAAREDEIKKMKESGGGAAAAAASVDADKLGARIKELETKLAEYEILEDDIADLSLYKEENVRLRSEIDKLKGGLGGTPAAAAAPPANEDIVAEFAQAVTQDSAPAAAASAEIKLQDTGNPMADFESAVNLERKMQGLPEASATPSEAPATAPPVSTPASAVEPAPPPAPAAPPPPAPSSEAPPQPAADATAEKEGDDLFAEFAAPNADAEEGALDTDKMMEEMAALVSMEPAKGNALNEEIDTEKMAAEATNLTKS